jgi:hypothetical protein
MCQDIARQRLIWYKLTNDIYYAPFYVNRCHKYNLGEFTWLCPILYDDVVAQKNSYCQMKRRRLIVLRIFISMSIHLMSNSLFFILESFIKVFGIINWY